MIDMKRPLGQAELLEMGRWNTPTIYNGWEQITRQDSGRDGVNVEPTTDYTPHMGAVAGYAVTVVIEPGNPEHQSNATAWTDYRKYIAGIPGPKIVVVQDLDRPHARGAFWGEVNTSIHRALGCVGTITDGAVRDLEQVADVGFKVLARQVCVGHAWSTPVRWDCGVEVFGRSVRPGDLVHGDRHGFLVIPPDEAVKVLEAARFMDTNECRTLIRAAREGAGRSSSEILEDFEAAAEAFNRATKEKFGKR